MKKVILFVGTLALVAFTTSCGKQCVCTYTEDGKKVGKTSSTLYKNHEYYGKFDKAKDCKDNSWSETIDGKKTEVKCK